MDNMSKLINHLCAIDDDCGCVSVETLDPVTLDLLNVVINELDKEFDYNDIDIDVRFERIETIDLN